MSRARTNYYKREYVEGNTVRQTSQQMMPGTAAAPVKRRRVDTQNRQNALTLNGAHVAFLAVVSIVCLMMCVAYLYIQSNITATRSNITDLKDSISTVQSQNNALNYSINSYVNVDHVYKVATTKLGMKQASDKQISNYKASDSGYTLQYGDIPNK
jgi:cell division protein FtsL